MTQICVSFQNSCLLFLILDLNKVYFTVQWLFCRTLQPLDYESFYLKYYGILISIVELVFLVAFCYVKLSLDQGESSLKKRLA